jgi:hypothetical protein
MRWVRKESSTVWVQRDEEGLVQQTSVYIRVGNEPPEPTEWGLESRQSSEPHQPDVTRSGVTWTGLKSQEGSSENRPEMPWWPSFACWWSKRAGLGWEAGLWEETPERVVLEGPCEREEEMQWCSETTKHRLGEGKRTHQAGGWARRSKRRRK